MEHPNRELKKKHKNEDTKIEYLKMLQKKYNIHLGV